MNGWVKLHRCLIDKAIWLKASHEHRSVLITILCLVNHEPNEWIWKGEKFKVESGQMITSLDSLAKKSGVSVRNIRTALDNFQKLEFLTNESTKTGRIITVINWALYQSNELHPTKQVTKTRQRPDKEVTTNKNIYISNYNNISLTEEEYEKLQSRFIDIDKRIERLSLYKESTGKKYKSDYATILSWANRETVTKGNPFMDKLKQMAMEEP